MERKEYHTVMAATENEERSPDTKCLKCRRKIKGFGKNGDILRRINLYGWIILNNRISFLVFLYLGLQSDKFFLDNPYTRAERSLRSVLEVLSTWNMDVV